MIILLFLWYFLSRDNLDYYPVIIFYLVIHFCPMALRNLHCHMTWKSKDGLSKDGPTIRWFFFREKHESRRTEKEKGRLIAGYSFIGKMILTAERWIYRNKFARYFGLELKPSSRDRKKKWQWNWKIVTNKKIDGDWCRCRLSFII